METVNYRALVRSIGSRKSLGQCFLVNSSIATMESAYGKGLNVIELGPGLGILTKELCITAKRVVAIEKDSRLFDILKSTLESKKLKLINDDFFSVDVKKLGSIDIMVSNIPYNLSSKVIYWLSSNDIPALICIQKEFAHHMLAKPGTRDYSKLSVVTSLRFKAHYVKNVAAGNFYPVPKVDSCIVYLAPRATVVNERIVSIISFIMNHKKKLLHNAIVDSAKSFGITKELARKLSSELKNSDARPFQLEPEVILEIAEHIDAFLSDQKE